MHCEEYELLISGMVDGEPPVKPGTDLFGHIAVCRGCQDFLRSLLRIKNAEAELLSEGPLPERLNSSDRTLHSHSLLRRRISISVSSAAIALVMLVLWTVVLGLTLMQSGGAGERNAREQYAQPPSGSPFARPAIDRPAFKSR
ncbi:MAG TPA: hypothetical protein VMF59_03755 [Bacteroidota bacterium]|nr:hypothetical protein [Bacteroidota bacterium]